MYASGQTASFGTRRSQVRILPPRYILLLFPWIASICFFYLLLLFVASICPHRLWVRSSGFQSEKASSSLAGGIRINRMFVGDSFKRLFILGFSWDRLAQRWSRWDEGAIPSAPMTFLFFNFQSFSSRGEQTADNRSIQVRVLEGLLIQLNCFLNEYLYRASFLRLSNGRTTRDY